MDISFSHENVRQRAVSLLLVLALIASAVVLPAFAASRSVHPIAGDWDCDGVTSAGWFSDGLVVLQSSKDPGASLRFNYGRPGDHPVVGDWNNDGCDTIGVVRRGHRWYLKDSNSGGAADHVFTYGSRLGRDHPVVGNWDGRGGDSPGVVRGSTWHLRNSLSGGPAHLTFKYGRVARGVLTDVGDWTNDGRDTPGVVRDGVWYLRDHNRAGPADTVFPYGRKNDLPVTGKWDGRGGDSPGVVRGTTWMVKNSAAGGVADGTFRFSDKTVDAAIEELVVEGLRRPVAKPTPEARPKTESGRPPSEPAPPSNPSSDGSKLIDSELIRTSIGSPTPTGSLTASEGKYVLHGGGRDIWYTSDSFEYAHQEVAGDASVITRIVDQTNTHPWAKAGVMFRADASAGSQHVSLFQTPANGVALQYRAATGGQSSHVAGPATTTPTWLRLDRSGDTFRGYTSDDAVNWRLVGVVTVPIAAAALVGLAVTGTSDGEASRAEFTGFGVGASTSSDSGEPDAGGPAPVEPAEAVAPITGSRLLYSHDDIGRYRSSMTGQGPYYAKGDAGHGGPYSPNDGQRALRRAADFLDNPRASYWNQPDLPYSPGDASPNAAAYRRPLDAAWIWMSQPDHPRHEELGRELKALLLAQARNPTLDFSDSTNYPVNYRGYAPGPIFGHAHWMTRMMKARDMLGREMFSAAENRDFDKWIYDYSNWTANWLHRESVGKFLPGRMNRDYTRVLFEVGDYRQSFDGGPRIGSAGMAYTNRHAAVASAMSLSANYLKRFSYEPSTSGVPAYGRFSVDELLEHSRLFVEETIRFSLWPEGVQGDFERGDRNVHSGVSAQVGWMYSANVLANLMEIAQYHAKRGDFSVWQYGTTEGFDGSAGVPVAGGFRAKSLHFYAWSMSRYVNGGWNRTNFGEPLALPHFYHDVMPAAAAHRFAPSDRVLEAAWKRSGEAFPEFASSPQSQGPFHAHDGEGSKMIGLVEDALGETLVP